MKGGYNFIIKNISNKTNSSKMRFIPSDFRINFYDGSVNNFEKTYNEVIMFKAPSKPFFFEIGISKKPHILSYENEEVYLILLGENTKKFLIEPIISQAEYFFGKTFENIFLNKSKSNTFETIYKKWETELLTAIQEKKITASDIHNFLFINKEIFNNIKIKNKNNLEKHKLKLLNKSSDYFNYITHKRGRQILHFYTKFFQRYPAYDLRPPNHKN
jgi:hypothetical protein